MLDSKAEQPQLYHNNNHHNVFMFGVYCPSSGVAIVTMKGTVKRPSSSRRTRKVTDIFTWVQCFNTYVSVLAPAHPETIPELMAYMSTIVRTSQDFSGLAWVRYDAGFRRQAALTGNRLWSQINATLYTLCQVSLVMR